MSDEPRLLYLEPDDEITSLVRRLGAQEPGRVIVVAPGRSRATSSLVALRLLARAARDGGREVALVADPPTRALAAEAGVAAFATLADAVAGTVTESGAEPRAPIRVVRGAAPVPLAPSDSGSRAPATPPIVSVPARPQADDMTVAVQMRAQGREGDGSGRRLRPVAARRRPGRGLVILLLVLVVAAGAALLPGATVSVARRAVPVGPVHITVTVPVADHRSGELTSTQQGTATGQRLDQVSATGTVTFFNWNLVTVAVPLGTQVSVKDGAVFVTKKRIVLAKGHFNGTTIDPGRGSVSVTAVAGGPAGNVAAGAIDTVVDSTVRGYLRGSPDNPNRLVSNAEPTSGGSETSHQVIQQSDVDALLAAISNDLATQLTAQLDAVQDAVFASADPPQEPNISIPPDLVGTEDQLTFSLTGSLAYDRSYALLTDVEASARDQFRQHPPSIPRGTEISAESIQVQVESAIVTGGSLNVQVRITAVAADAVDPNQVRDLVAGLSVADARAALSDFGEVQIDLWPSWVDQLPRLGFRISVLPVDPQPGGTP